MNPTLRRLVLAAVVIAVLYLGSFLIQRSGLLSPESFSRVNDTTSKYRDSTRGYSLFYPSSFVFKKTPYSEHSYYSNSVDGVGLGLGFDSSGLCVTMSKLVDLPQQSKMETYSKSVVNGNTVYKDIQLSAYPSGFLATYAVAHGYKCILISESNEKNDFNILDSILGSLKFE